MIFPHETFMQRCIQLAGNGEGTTAPNPLVGCVIVHNNKIIGEGWHYQSGTHHAEVHAIQSVKNQALLAESTLYVSLEPCAHYGKTPPCASLIVEKKIPKVVIGSHDPNPQVAGKGVQILKNAGIEVISGVCQEHCDQLNKTFFHFHKTKKPYVILKWAQSNDGFMDADRSARQKGSIAISNIESRAWAHQLRSTCDAILIGSGTAFVDEPTLNTRLYFGRNPQKVVLDRQNQLPENHPTLKDAWHITTKGKNFTKHNYQQVALPEENFLHHTLDWLAGKGIQSILVEGGATILTSFISRKLWQEAFVVQAPHLLYRGLKAPEIQFSHVKNFNINTDTIYQFTP